jgi:hypothetical protein
MRCVRWRVSTPRHQGTFAPVLPSRRRFLVQGLHVPTLVSQIADGCRRQGMGGASPHNLRLHMLRTRAGAARAYAEGSTIMQHARRPAPHTASRAPGPSPRDVRATGLRGARVFWPRWGQTRAAAVDPAVADDARSPEMVSQLGATRRAHIAPHAALALWGPTPVRSRRGVGLGVRPPKG